MAEEKISESKKEAALSYLEKNQIQEFLHNAINEVLTIRSPDPCGILSQIMLRAAVPPTVNKCVIKQVLDSNGDAISQVEVYVEYMGEVKRIGSASGAIKETADLKGSSLEDLAELDRKLNGSAAHSMALALSAAQLFGKELFILLSEQFRPTSRFRIPTLYVCVLELSENMNHSNVMIIPRDDIPFVEQLRLSTEVYHKLGLLLTKKYGAAARNVGVFGGFACDLKLSNGLSIVERAIVITGYEPGKDFRVAVSSSMTFNPQSKTYEFFSGSKTSEQMVEYWNDIIKEHPAIAALEDPFDEKDCDSFHQMTKNSGIEIIRSNVRDLNALEQCIRDSTCNSVALNLTTTNTDLFAMAKQANDSNFRVVVACQSAETCDSGIADLAVGIGANAVQIGAPVRGERVQKYTRLLQIYEYLRANNTLLV